MTGPIPIAADSLADFCRMHSVRELAIVGSRARGDSHPESDVDVVIDLRQDARVGLIALQRMQTELVALFGCPVDLVTRDGLNRHIRNQVMREARILYAE